MRINIKTTNVTLTATIAEYANKKLEKVAVLLEKDPSAQCDVELGKVSEHHQKGEIFKAEIHIIGAGKNIYATSEKTDLLQAIDAVRDEVLGELRSGKGKRVSLIRRSGARVKAMVKGMWGWRK